MAKNSPEAWRRFPWRRYINEKILAEYEVAGNEVVVLPPYVSPGDCTKANVFIIIPCDLDRTKHPSDLVGVPTIGIREAEGLFAI